MYKLNDVSNFSYPVYEVLVYMRETYGEDCFREALLLVNVLLWMHEDCGLDRLGDVLRTKLDDRTSCGDF